METKMCKTILIKTDKLQLSHWINMVIMRVERKQPVELACYPAFVNVAKEVIENLEHAGIFVTSEHYGNVGMRFAILYKLQCNYPYDTAFNFDLPPESNNQQVATNL
jgi:hypothetical protein